MGVKTLKINGNVEIVRISNPNWNQVEENIRKLNGKNYMELSLTFDDANEMLITGGHKGLYLCEILEDNTHKGLIHPNKSSDLTFAVNEGEPDDFEETLISDLETVIIAAKCFVDFGVANENMVWEET